MNDFTSDFFVGNRQQLMNSLPDSLIVISAHNLLQYSVDEPYPFRQDSNFWYLSGINEPDMVLVMDTKKKKSYLLLPDQNDYQKDWDGEINKKHLELTSGINYFLQRSDLCKLLKEAQKTGLEICYIEPPLERIEPYGFYTNPARRIIETEIKKVIRNPKDVRLEIARLRQAKQPIEIETIQHAIDITADTLKMIKKNLVNYKTEKDIDRALGTAFISLSDGHKFEPIVASGKNAATIHYKNNNSSIQNNSLLLLDVGAKVGMYGSDISRTWAVGKPSKRQKDIYDAVLEVHMNALSRLKAGVYLKEQQEFVNDDLKIQCKKLGIPETELPTGLSHFLGIDTHDAGIYAEPLVENAVITVEPGMYLANEGIGVRIEDDVLILRDGIKILSGNIPKNL